MKTILLIAALHVLPQLSIAQTELKIDADMRGRSCIGGFGICGVSGSSEIKTTDTTYKSTAQKLDETTLILKFNKTMLSEQEQKSLLHTTLIEINESQSLEFVQEDDLIVDNVTLRFLGIDPKYHLIKKGRYPLAITSDTIKITLRLWER